MDLDLVLDSILSMGWVGSQICEILWIRFWGWIHFRPQIGSDYGFVFLLEFGFGFGLIFVLNSKSVNLNPTTSTGEHEMPQPYPNAVLTWGKQPNTKKSQREDEKHDQNSRAATYHVTSYIVQTIQEAIP